MDVQGDSEQVDVTLHWAGGVESRHRLIRPVQRYEQLSTYPLLMARIETLYHEGLWNTHSGAYLLLQVDLPHHAASI